MASPVLGPAGQPVATATPNASLDLRAHGLLRVGPVYANRSPAELTEIALARGEGLLAYRGALAAYTGARTGRSPKDRYVIAEPGKKDEIWWGPSNQPMEPSAFERLHEKVTRYLQGPDLFVNDGFACAHPKYQLKVRVIADKAWHALFSHCLFLRPDPHAPSHFVPDVTILDASGLLADPKTDGTRSEVFIALHLARRLVLIGGTQYAGEIKKSVFSLLNYLMPQRGVFPMHCSANTNATGDTALFFGLSGTGKTTLSADPERNLIGDDEHGWSDDGVFNFEGGCYAKTIHLSAEGEPQIWNAIRFGCVLENVVLDPWTRQPDYDDARYTENTRAAYPVDYIDNCELLGRGGHPSQVIFLTCDAFGVLPPLSRLTLDQALYHFLSGYTAKVAGTEAGVTEPSATFSTCFAAPFLPLHPTRYAELLGDRLRTYGSQVWLVNTGWTGGSFGQGHRIELRYTRSMVRAILNGSLADVPVTPDAIFGVLIPSSCHGVPTELLQPRSTWKNQTEYEAKARKLADLFQANFKTYAGSVSEAVRTAGPRMI
ncbi:MAG TPA: phosphoenolpyruvate carboxykinase (ATP) [Gemmataceae bacterium]|nr:phosphoenolpyruvate carboxykinase (ATP) [Gemmataceae bacterium]